MRSLSHLIVIYLPLVGRPVKHIRYGFCSTSGVKFTVVYVSHVTEYRMMPFCICIRQACDQLETIKKEKHYLFFKEYLLLIKVMNLFDQNVLLIGLMADLCLPLCAGEDTFELHSVQLELEAVERQIGELLGKQAQLRERRATLETSRLTPTSPG